VDRAFDVAGANANIALSNLAFTYDGTAKAVTVTTNPAGLSVTLTYSQNGVGVAAPTSVGSYDVTATITDPNYQGSTTGVLVINKATPVVTWANPSNITFGTPLGATQFNATANVPGTFQYSLPAGTVLNAGTNQLSVAFTPTDAVNYEAVTANMQLTVEAPSVPVVTFSSATYSANEDGGNVAIEVNRGGDISTPATVSYITPDLAGLKNCNVVDGSSSPRCDYATVVGTLEFAPGESTKTIYIPLVDDAFTEGLETFTVTLLDPVGVSLGATSSATIAITDNDTTPATGNPVDDVPFFTRQQYIDFLGREPDAVGFPAWQSIISNCAQGDTLCDKIEVSSAFFRSEEFQSRGYFIYRFYSALGKTPRYAEFMPDLAKVSGFLSNEQLEANKGAFVEEFMARQEFKDRYDSLTDPTAYVDGLLQTTGLPNHPSRDGWIAGLRDNSLRRADVLRQLVESAESHAKLYNESFVVMQYFGYLRRDPDIHYLEWIDTMNQNGGDYRTMINGFVNSAEYRSRFGQ
jgi:hypothetical protein